MKKLAMDNSVVLAAESIRYLQSLKPVIDKVRGISKTGVNEYLALINGETPMLKVIVVVDAGAIFEDSIPVGVITTTMENQKIGFHLDLEALLNSMSYLSNNCQFLWDLNHWAIKEEGSEDFIKGALNEIPFSDETLDELLFRFETSSQMNYVDKFSFTFDELTERALDAVATFRTMQPSCNGIWVSKTNKAIECQSVPYGTLKLKGSIESEEDPTTNEKVGKCVSLHSQAGDIFRQVRTLKALESLNMDVYTLDASPNPACNYIATIGDLKILIQSQPSGAAYFSFSKEAYTPVNACKATLPASEVLPVLNMFNSIIPKASWANGVVMMSVDPSTYSENDKTIQVLFSFEGDSVNLKKTITATDVENIEALQDKEAILCYVFELLKTFIGKKDNIVMSFDSEGIPTDEEYASGSEEVSHKSCIGFESATACGLAAKFDFS